MSKPFLAAFQAREEEARRFADLGPPLVRRICGELHGVYQSKPDDPLCQDALRRLEMDHQDMTTALQNAFQRLLDSLHHPELVLATTGTTSSGKSALVNLLCGAEIMPVAFDEMSAGVVSIRHGPGRTLTVQQTKEAAWECGTWSGLSDEEIYQCLLGVMRAYHRCREHLGDNGGNHTLPACPRFDLEYPTRIGSHPELLDLPGCCRFRILDLPGLKVFD
jgi:hypothetical protein